jgi:cobalt/nickel transport system permease protein
MLTGRISASLRPSEFAERREPGYMHIPDGYLSPLTCVALYASAAPFWYVALRRVKSVLHTRLVPLLSVFSAFSFVVMMFNLPLPGGTTGHALGVGIAAVVLGPWASMLAISVALLIQALFFGDGGITAFGANCFNMAIVGSLVATGVYRLLAGRSALTSRRRVVAAAIAGYVAINAAALCASIEFGLQPMLFHDGTGAPLYAPYPLHIAIPAMMIGHVTFAGLAELIVSGGVVAYLQRTDPAMLGATALPEVVYGAAGAGTTKRSGWRATRPLWLGLALLMVLTPLGLLAAGTAWGEWGPQDFGDDNQRATIAAASGNVAPPSAPPQGLSRLANVWTAPMPDYAPVFMKSASFGYILSAMFGTGLIVLLCLGFGRLATVLTPEREG